MILVTGATGKNGLELIHRLLDKGERVSALARNPEKAAHALPGEVEIVRGDMDDAAALNAAMEGVDKVFLLCGNDERQAQLETNVTHAAAKAGVSHLVKFSVIHASMESPSALIRWHAQAEANIRASGIPFTFLRPNMFMQELLRQAGSIKERGEFYLPLGDARVSLTDVRDIADVAAAVLTTDGHAAKVYEITGPAGLSFHEVAAALSTAAGKTVRYVPVPMEGWKQGFAATGAPQWLIDTVADLYKTFEPANAHVGTGVQDVLGRPATSFEQFAKDHAAQFKA